MLEPQTVWYMYLGQKYFIYKGFIQAFVWDLVNLLHWKNLHKLWFSHLYNEHHSSNWGAIEYSNWITIFGKVICYGKCSHSFWDVVNSVLYLEYDLF